MRNTVINNYYGDDRSSTDTNDTAVDSNIFDGDVAADFGDNGSSVISPV
jgi:hypothetical protein